MLIVDTHCHALPHWFEPVEVLLHQMHANGVEKALLVQVRGQFDNRYLIECVRRFPGRFSPIVVVDTDRPDAQQVLEQWVGEGAEGVRLGPTVRSPGNDPLAIWRKAAELGLPVSSLGSFEGFTSVQFTQVVREFPSLPIIVEHLGGIAGTMPRPMPNSDRSWHLHSIPTSISKSMDWARFARVPCRSRSQCAFRTFRRLSRWHTTPSGRVV